MMFASFLSQAGCRVWSRCREIVAIADDPWPVARMVRSGLSIGTGVVALMLTGEWASAVLCGFFANLLVFTDQAGPLRDRLLVVGTGAILCTAAGLAGTLIGEQALLLLAATFAMGLLAGFLHGSLPGVEMVPRQAMICLVAGAHLPPAYPSLALALAIGTACVIGGILADHAIRSGVRGPSLANLRAMVSYPSPQFSFVYATMACAGLLIGTLWGETRPYWVTITILVVMQPDRRASTLRALQRFAGTILGVLVASAIAGLTPVAEQQRVIIAVALLTPFLWPLAFLRNHALGIAVLSTWVFMLLDLVLPSGEALATLFTARLADTAIGCALALLGHFFVREVDPALDAPDEDLQAAKSSAAPQK